MRDPDAKPLPKSEDFGHFGAGKSICAGGFIDCWGSGPFVIFARGKAFRFEDSDRFGPSRVNKDGEIAANPFFAERSPFWPAWERWKSQGRLLDADGMTCLYDLDDALP